MKTVYSSYLLLFKSLEVFLQECNFTLALRSSKNLTSTRRAGGHDGHSVLFLCIATDSSVN